MICSGPQLTKPLPSDDEFCIVPSLSFLRNAIGDSDLVAFSAQSSIFSMSSKPPKNEAKSASAALSLNNF